VEQVSQFGYSGGLKSKDGCCTKDIRSRIEIAKKLFTGKVNLELKKRIKKCLVWSVD